MFSFFFFNDTATTEIYTLSLHDALPIYMRGNSCCYHYYQILTGAPGRHLLRQSPRQKIQDLRQSLHAQGLNVQTVLLPRLLLRSEEHTSELQSRQYLVCRLLLEKKKKQS